MDKVPGDCVEVAMLPDGTFSPQVIRGRQLDTARIMGELHNVDPRAVGLGDEPGIPWPTSPALETRPRRVR